MISPDQCRAARILLGWSAQQVADVAEVGIATVKRFEAGQGVQPTTNEAIERGLTNAGIIFIAAGETPPDGGAGVRLS